MKLYPEDAVILAPLAGYTNLPYRRSMRRHGCYYAFTEMIDTGALIYNKKAAERYLARGPEEPWLGVQIVSAKVEDAKRAVEIINAYDFSVLDFNLGCPTPKVVKKGKGSGLAKNIDLAANILEAIVKNSKFLVTAKIRIQAVEDPTPTVVLAKKLENAGAQAITIHGRISKAMYSGDCYAEIIAAVKSELRIQVVANGGVVDLKSYLELQKRSGCGPIMIARGAMGNPWIFEEIKNKQTREPTISELCAEMQVHISDVVEYYGEQMGMKISRKLILDYLAGRGFPGELRATVTSLKTMKEFEAFIQKIQSSYCK